MSISMWNPVLLMCLLMCFLWHRHQKLRFKQWERRAPATAERRAAAAAPGSEAGAVLQSEISTERTHQNGKKSRGASNSSLFPPNLSFSWRLFLLEAWDTSAGSLTSVLLCDIAIWRLIKIHFFWLPAANRAPKQSGWGESQYPDEETQRNLWQVGRGINKWCSI